MKQISRQEIQCQTLNELARQVKKHSGKLRFPIYLTEELMRTDLEELELSVRSLNCLRRAGYKTIGQLAEGITGSGDLRSIRNCGRRCISEIMSSLLQYQYAMLSPARQQAFLERTYYLSTHPELFEEKAEGGVGA